MTRKLLDYARPSIDEVLASAGIVLDDIATFPTQRMPAVSKLVGALYGPFAEEARAWMQSGETTDAFFLRMFLFYQQAQQQDSDTALVAALERSESR